MRGFHLGLLVLLMGCQNKTEEKPVEVKQAADPKTAEDVGEILATVNGSAIGAKDFQRAAARKVPADGKALSLKEKNEVIDRLVKEELLYQEAFSRKLYRDPKVKKVMVNALLREDVYSQIRNKDFNDQELESYFNAHKEEFTIPEKVQFSRILIKVKKDRDDAASKAEAERIHSELKKNSDGFKSLAEKSSDGPYKRRGGDVGFVSKKGKPGLDTEIVDKAFTMTKGQLSSPFKTKAGYNIIMIKEKREAMERSFQQMKGTVLRKLKNEKLSGKYDEYTEKLRAGAEVSVDDAKVGSVEIKSSKPSPGLKPGGLNFGPGAKKPKIDKKAAPAAASDEKKGQ